MSSLPRVCMRWLLPFALLAYAGFLLALWVYQRQLLYLPASLGSDATPASFGLAGAKDLALPTSDGETLDAWYAPARAGRAFFLVFHGTGGNLGSMSGFLKDLSSDGSGFLAIDYRGYGRSSGRPTERGLLRDGEAAYEKARQLGYAQARIVVLGESLGSAVAVAVARAHQPRAVVLDSAFSSAAGIAAARYWMFAVRFLMLDSFDAQAWIAGVAAPKLFIHGGRDDAIDVAFGRRLYEAASEPKTFLYLPQAGHLVLWRAEGMNRMRAWLSALPEPR